jgi:two-component system, OmpR family, alkaline phosphatase synthesis response regulator PhoP
MKILIAEDDLRTREGLAELLENEGYEVIAAADGGEALDLYRSQEPDLLLLDIMMPVKSGYELCREIRKTDDLTPLLFLSAKSEEIDKVLGLELGADDYVTKPFGAREITARIKTLLRRAARAAIQAGAESGNATDEKEHFSMGELELFPGQLRARRGNSWIDLTEREVKILALLAKNPGKVIDRNTLFDVAWGSSYIPESRTLDQTIAVLRKKIEREPARPDIIKTVHSAGYRWEGEEEIILRKRPQ